MSDYSVSFSDNDALASVLGEHDKNLKILEDAFTVEARVHGNIVTFSGSRQDMENAAMLLEDLYRRAKAGEEIHSGEILGDISHIREARLGLHGDGNGKDIAWISTRKRAIKARSPAQSAYISALKASELVISSGPAGTGKTYLAVAAAAACMERGEVERIVLSRPAVEAGEQLGFLPGDMREKVDPYLRPLYDALYDVLPAKKVEKGLESGAIEIAPLAFMRGRTLSHAFVILDEAQNCTQMQMKMFLTRLGEESRMVVTGDITQIDLPKGQKSGLVDALAILDNLDGVAIITLSDRDIVRHSLVTKIVKAYAKAER
jgi:phosphate starvation-inducible PhoH-like protein